MVWNKKKLLLTLLVMAGASATLWNCTKALNAEALHVNESKAEIHVAAEVHKVKFKNREVSLNDFVKWYSSEEYHLNKEYDVAEFKYTLNHRPAECLTFLELRRQPYDYSLFTETKKNYENMIYFNLKIEVVGGKNELLKYKLSSPAQYESRIKYLSFDMQKDIYAVQGKDTIYPGLYQFERIFDVAPYSTVSLAFDSKYLKKGEAMTIVYNDKLFYNGNIKFNYQKEQLTDLPTVIEL